MRKERRRRVLSSKGKEASVLELLWRATHGRVGRVCLGVAFQENIPAKNDFLELPRVILSTWNFA